ncbi:MAG: class I SAM-dependent methyltransferase [Nitrospirae bacterium]|nr:class I SAM-dependent methyltransferase [Nitrospirota bacterium]MBF0541587.1 class I SAM-dependent methyltransferase [Nitrospirota bacterium]
MNKIELIPLNILDERRQLVSFVKDVASRLGLQFGWHYILDIVWILEQIEILGIPKGSVILDAGAGNGIVQFCLARLGYKVISVDFSERNPSYNIKRVFKIINLISNKTDFNHKYLNHLKTTLPLQQSIIKESHKIILNILSKIRDIFSQDLKPEITFYKADLQNMELIQSDSIDAVVSVSVMEHNEAEEAQNIMRELRRVLKKNAPMVITTSASGIEDWFHEPSHGWAYSERTIAKLFLFSDTQFESNYGLYDEMMEELRRSEELKKTLSPMYFKSGDNGMPWGKWSPQYYPVGIVYTKLQ